MEITIIEILIVLVGSIVLAWAVAISIMVFLNFSMHKQALEILKDHEAEINKLK